ncbi:hypothetical protein M5X16_28660 [Paenibacillus chitinolyticus]|nr:hypothetical protein [Paenibacillus chitinolyticus]MCY9599723.1 hypothetical protein [Paenibacillus chitinolyticus]
MAIVKTKLEILVDLSDPVEEIKSCIVAIVNQHPAKQKEIMLQVDTWVGEALAQMSLHESGEEKEG